MVWNDKMQMLWCWELPNSSKYFKWSRWWITSTCSTYILHALLRPEKRWSKIGEPIFLPKNHGGVHLLCSKMCSYKGDDLVTGSTRKSAERSPALIGRTFSVNTWSRRTTSSRHKKAISSSQTSRFIYQRWIHTGSVTLNQCLLDTGLQFQSFVLILYRCKTKRLTYQLNNQLNV